MYGITTGSDVLWGDGNDALFQGTGGSVAVNGTVTPTNIFFNGPGYIVSGGTVNFTNGGATITTNAASATINSAVTASSNLYTAGSGALTINGGLNVAGTLNQNPNSGLLTVYQPAGFSGTIGTVTATTSGTTVVLGGDPSSSTTITNALNTVGQTVEFNGGNWSLPQGGAYQSSLVVNAGVVTRPIGGGDFKDLQSFTMTGGTLNALNTYGMRMGNTSGVGAGGGAVPFTGLQTGGLVVVSNSNNQSACWDPPATASRPATR